MKKNVASQSIGVQMITALDGSDFSGTVSVDITKDNGTKTAGALLVTNLGGGYYTYGPSQAETNADHVAFSFSGTGAISATVQLYTEFPQSVDNATNISTILADTNELQVNQNNWLTATGFATTAEIADVPTVAEFNARTILSANYSTAANLATVDSNVDAILIDTNDLQTSQGDWLTATGFNTVVPPSVAQFNARSILSDDYFIVSDYTAPDNAGIAQTQVDIAALNDITVNEILTTQMTESYSADGVSPTVAQSLFLTMQNLQDFSFAGTTQTVKRIDGATTAATYTLDDATAPTSKTRAT